MPMTTAHTSAAKAGWYHGWNIVAVCVLSQSVALALTLSCFSLFLKDWTREFSVPVSTLTIAVTIFSLGCSLCTPFAGAAADKFPARWVFGPALVALVIFHLAIGFVGEPWQILLLYSTILPVAISFSSTVPAQALVSRWFVKRVGTAMGVTSFGLAAAAVVFPPVIALLLPQLGWRMIFWIFGGVIAFICLPVILLVIRDRPTPEEGAYYVGTGGRPAHSSTLTVREVFRRRNFWVTVGVFVPIQCVVMGVQVNLAPIVASHGFSPTTAGLLISAGAIGGLFSKLVSGLLADRLGNRIPLVVVSLISATGAVVLAFLGDQLPMLYLAMILIGLSGGVWTLLASATAAEFGPQGFGRAFGIIAAFTPLGAVAPPIVARLQEASGSYAAGLAGLAVFVLGGAGVALLMREKRAAAPPAAGLAAEPAE
jgi:MFS family permease